MSPTCRAYSQRGSYALASACRNGRHRSSHGIHLTRIGSRLSLVPPRTRLGLSRQLPILGLLAMRSGGLRHIFILRHKPSFCLCASVSRLSTRLLILVTELALGRPQQITFVEMRDLGVRGVLIYCADYRCSHSIAIIADHCLRPEHTSARAAAQRQ